MDRGERRIRTERTIRHRVRTRVAESQRLYADEPTEDWRAPHLHRVRVGWETRWTFYEWLTKPGTLRKHSGSHGSCRICEYRNPKREEPSLEWEMAQISENNPMTVGVDLPDRTLTIRRRRKNTRRWCRGKVGVPHQTSWRPVPSHSDSRELVCSVCGKKLDWCCHARWWPLKERCRCGRSRPTVL